MIEEELVSICMITYNHESYIRQAIESVLAQETSFPYKLYIGEDFSTDNTRTICLDYQEKYPDKIQVLDNSRNLGAIKNFKRTLQACPGKYVAILEGDDFWLDPQKLRKQLNFLETHPDFTICYTNNFWLYPSGEKEAKFTGKEGQDFLSLHDVVEKNYVATQTCVFRNKLVDFPEWFETLYIGDWPLHILNALHGKIKHLDEYTAVYRVHETGIWSKLKSLTKEEHLAKMLEHVKTVLPTELHPVVESKLRRKYYFLSSGFKKEKELEKSRLYYKKFRSLSNSLLDKEFYKLTAKVYLLN